MMSFRTRGHGAEQHRSARNPKTALRGVEHLPKEEGNMNIYQIRRDLIFT